MANIVSSTFASFSQADGTKTVHEVHTDLLGLKHDRTYERVSAGADLSALLATHAIEEGLQLNALEITNNITSIISLGSLATITLNFSTSQENAAALRVLYQTATRIEAVMMGDFLNMLTNAQIANAFGITTTQAATLRTNKLAPAASLATSIRAATGQ